MIANLNRHYINHIKLFSYGNTGLFYYKDGDIRVHIVNWLYHRNARKKDYRRIGHLVNNAAIDYLWQLYLNQQPIFRILVSVTVN